MIKYDASKNLLDYSKVDLDLVDLDVIKELRADYEKYINHGLQKDLDFLSEAMLYSFNIINKNNKLITLDSLPVKRADEEIEVSERLMDFDFEKKFNLREDVNVPIYIEFFYRGEWCKPLIPIIKIPYMNSRGVLNVSGNKKVLLRALELDYDVSFQNKGELLNMKAVGTETSFQFALDTKGHKLTPAGMHSLDVNNMLRTLLHQENEGRNLEDVLTNNRFKIINNDNPHLIVEQLAAKTAKNTTFQFLSSNRAKLSTLRDRLNELLNIDDVVGETIGKDLELPRNIQEGKDLTVIQKGETITPHLLRQIRRNAIDTVHIKYTPKLEGYTLTEDIVLTDIPVGTYIGTSIANIFDIEAGVTREPIKELTLRIGTELTQDMVKLCYNMDVEYIRIEDKKVIPMYREYIGNRAFKLNELEIPQGLVEEYIKAGYNAEEYVYVPYGYKPWEDRCMRANSQFFNVDDLLALTSLQYKAYDNPNTRGVKNVDTDFVKRIAMPSETISKAFRESIKTILAHPDYTRTNKSKLNELSNLIQSGVHQTEDYINVLYTIHFTFLAKLQESKRLVPVEDTNPLSEISQVTRVINSGVDKHATTAEMRYIALPYFGRLDPYETPAGSKIGLTNSVTAVCKIEDGTPKTPYLPVLTNQTTGRKYIDVNSELVYMDTREEQHYCLGDLIDLKFKTSKPDNKGHWEFDNSRLTARVPSMSEGELITIESLMSYNLNYVTAHPEQHCSITTMFVPFAAANDGVRIQYALNLMKQSLPLLNAEEPRVITPMYKKIFDFNDEYVLRAEDDGRITDISNRQVLVFYDNLGEVEYNLDDFKVSSSCFIPTKYNVVVNDEVKKGDIIAETNISPNGTFATGAHGFVAYTPYRGLNFEDAIPISNRLANKFNTCRIETQTFKTNSDELFYKNIDMGDIAAKTPYVEKGAKILTVEKKNKPGKVITAKEEGILVHHEINNEKKEDLRLGHAPRKEHKLYYLTYNDMNKGDKISGRHGNKGVSSKIIPNNKMLRFKNGEHVDLYSNPFGIVSRMNIGQLMESYVGFAAYLLDTQISVGAFNGASLQEVKDLIGFCYDLANNKDLDFVISKWEGTYPKLLLERARHRHEYIRTWEGCFTRNGNAILYDPMTGKYKANEITIGYVYMLKVDHEVDHKVTSRAGEAEGYPYAEYTQQPTKGRASKGGQKVGEMESATIAAYGASETLYEMYNVKSDNIEERTNYATTLLGLDMPYSQEDVETTNNRGVENWILELEALGVRVASYDNSQYRIDNEYIKKKRRYSLPLLEVTKNIKKLNNQEPSDDYITRAALGDFDDY